MVNIGPRPCRRSPRPRSSRSPPAKLRLGMSPLLATVEEGPDGREEGGHGTGESRGCHENARELLDALLYQGTSPECEQGQRQAELAGLVGRWDHCRGVVHDVLCSIPRARARARGNPLTHWRCFAGGSFVRGRCPVRPAHAQRTGSSFQPSVGSAHRLRREVCSVRAGLLRSLLLSLSRKPARPGPFFFLPLQPHLLTRSLTFRISAFKRRVQKRHALFHRA
jgi:hypothetical protein